MANSIGHGDDAEFEALCEASARIGSDPLLVQGAGGNTSIKRNGALWIKASGTWLKNAVRDEIMVPVALSPLLAAVADQSPEAETPQSFTLAELNPGKLRPSIETTVHALLPQRVVIHVHCVATIALAVRADAEVLLAERLRGLNWAFVQYKRPGLALAHGIAERLKPSTDVLILGNHGLAVAADTVAEAEALMRHVSGLLSHPPRSAPAADIDVLLRLAAGSDYRLPEFSQTHAAATDLVSCRIAAAGSLYPDHVIFLGDGSHVAGPREDAAQAAARANTEGRDPVLILFPGKGVLIRRSANAGAEAMARCLADVAARIDADARIRYLTVGETAELLDWDAEKYRQELDKRGGVALQ